MALQGELERYEEWRSTFRLSEEGPHTFRQLDRLRRIDNIVWGETGKSEQEKLTEISAVLAE